MRATCLIPAIMWGIGAVLALTGPAQAQIYAAKYTEPTDRYDHGILGDAIEWGGLRIFDRQAGRITIRLPQNRVFEDIAPRVVDVTGDGKLQVVVVETDLSLGARLAIYDQRGLVAATPFLGRTHRWLAPVGVADLDGDGRPEIAYVEKPHLTMILKIWRFENGHLKLVAALPGLPNHRIGQDFISGGIRDCGGGPEIITANSNWRAVMATVLHGGALETRKLGPFKGKASFKAAMACR